MKTLLTLMILLIAFSSFSQIQVEKPIKKNVVGRVAPAGQFLAELDYYVSEDNDTIYTLMYKNQEYSSILDLKHLRFSSEGNALNAFYDILKTFFLDENKKNKDYKVQLKLGQDQVTLSNYRQMGITGVFISPPEGYFILSERHVDKLFGKE